MPPNEVDLEQGSLGRLVEMACMQAYERDIETGRGLVERGGCQSASSRGGSRLRSQG